MPGFRRTVDLALDLGTSNTRIMGRGRGLLAEVPTVVAVQATPRGREIVATGVEARKMLGRTPAGTEVIRPVRGAVVVDFAATEHLLKALLSKSGARTFLRPKLLVVIAPDLSEVERKAVQESARAAGGRDVSLVPSPMAAALGAELPVTRPVGSMIVDVGGGRTDVAVISLGGLVAWRSVRIAGDQLDAAIAQWLRNDRDLLVGEHTAEAIKLRTGCVEPVDPPLTTRIRGRDISQGVPREVDLDSNEIRGAMQPVIDQIRDTVLEVLADTPPELAADILSRGVILCGGGAKLRGLDRLLRDATGLPVLQAEDPLRCVARGAARLLDDDALFERMAVPAS